MVPVRAFAAMASLAIASLGFTYAQAGQPVGGEPAGGSVKVATPPAATPPAAIAPAAAVDPAKGRELFTTWGCNSCHTLADAGASGHVGPSLDGNTGLTHDLIVNRVTNGAGAMPGFGGQMTDEEIGTVATYVLQVAAK